MWIVPNATDAQRLENIMNTGQLRTNSSLNQGSYPKFHPHITLASLPLSVENNLTDIEASIATSLNAPLTVKFSSVEIGSHYFRSVYITIEPTSEIMNLHERVHEALHAIPRTPSFPHLSLCYITTLKLLDAEIVPTSCVPRGGGDASAVWDFCV